MLCGSCSVRLPTTPSDVRQINWLTRGRLAACSRGISPGCLLQRVEGIRAVATGMFTVAGVNDHEVGLELGALAGDWDEDVRVDPPHGGIDDLNFLVGKLILQHEFEDACESICRLGRTHRGRATQDKRP